MVLAMRDAHGHIAPVRVGFIGAGMMGAAMIRGLVKSGAVAAGDIHASDINPSCINNLRADITGFAADDRDNGYVVEHSDVVVLAVEPKDMLSVCRETRTARKEPFSDGKIFVSLAAGVTIASLESWLGAGAIVRVMPNTPCVVGEMAAGYVCNETLSAAPKDVAMIGSMLGALGSAVAVHDEADLDAVTGVSGSGPAYVFQFIEAMSDGGVRCGLHRQVATTLAAKTVLGAAKMVLETGRHPGALKDEVTSPGGTTIAAVHALECGGMRATVINAVVAATEKSRELGRASRDDSISCEEDSSRKRPRR